MEEIIVKNKIIQYPIQLAEEVRNKIYSIDMGKYNVKGKARLILTYCVLVSYRMPGKVDIVSMDMSRIAEKVGTNIHYISKYIDILIKEGIISSQKEGVVGNASKYTFLLEPTKGYSTMKFNEYKKSEEDQNLVNTLNQVSQGARALYCVMKNNNNNEVTILSTREGEKWLGVSHPMVMKYLKELENFGLIFSNEQNRYFPKEYEYITKGYLTNDEKFKKLRDSFREAAEGYKEQIKELELQLQAKDNIIEDLKKQLEEAKEEFIF